MPQVVLLQGTSSLSAATAHGDNNFASCVVGETCTYLRMEEGYAAARRFVDGLGDTAKRERTFVTDAVARDASQILRRSAEHPFSFVDLTSFARMRQERIRYAFAFDAHFPTAGVMRIPRDVRLPA